LGIDPGLAITGYGLVRKTDRSLEVIDYGVVRTSPEHSLPERLQILYQELSDLIQQYRPKEGAVEELFFSRNVRTAMSVGQARGVALLALANAGIDIVEYQPLTVKQAVSGYGGADKAQMQTMVKMLLGLESIPRPDDAADALAVAICHLHSTGLNTMLRDSL
jgi:crossover junction endodeoxyribonuclease RuvC